MQKGWSPSGMFKACSNLNWVGSRDQAKLEALK